MRPLPAHKRWPSGRSIDVFWPLDKCWYRATVLQSVPLRKKQVVLYKDDEDVEELNLIEQEAEGLIRTASDVQEDLAQNLVDIVEGQEKEKWRICLR